MQWLASNTFGPSVTVNTPSRRIKSSRSTAVIPAASPRTNVVASAHFFVFSFGSSASATGAPAASRSRIEPGTSPSEPSTAFKHVSVEG